MSTLYYVYSPSRAHKLLPLLSDHSIVKITGWHNLFSNKINKSAEKSVVMIDNFGRFGLLGLVFSIFYSVPLVIRLRGDYFSEARERRKYQKTISGALKYYFGTLLARFCFYRAIMVIPNSAYLFGRILPYVAGKQISIVHNPVTACSSGMKVNKVLPHSDLHLLTVTNMGLYPKIKPILQFIEFNELSASFEHMNIQWVICGDGFYMQPMFDLVNRMGLQDRVHLYGNIDCMSDMYKWCDVYYHPTEMDAFPNATMEAMLHGCPVITNVKSCGVREQVFDMENGIITSNNGEVVDALYYYSREESRRRDHGSNGKRLAENRFSIAEQKTKMNSALQLVGL